MSRKQTTPASFCCRHASVCNVEEAKPPNPNLHVLKGASHGKSLKIIVQYSVSLGMLECILIFGSLIIIPKAVNMLKNRKQRNIRRINSKICHSLAQIAHKGNLSMNISSKYISRLRFLHIFKNIYIIYDSFVNNSIMQINKRQQCYYYQDKCFAQLLLILKLKKLSKRFCIKIHKKNIIQIIVSLNNTNKDISTVRNSC